MHSKKFTCPNCNLKFKILDVFKIKKNQDFICSNCKISLTPVLNKKVEKTWEYGFLIGLISSIFPAQTYLIFNDDLFIALLIGFMCGISMLIIYVYIIYKTTSFDVK